ncbi:tyrosinase family protein [Aquimarina brevivitae]|uniref:Tyrosinase n=1 Tax=Aquimarina brevivitae TaxID=323412 RepID=A0A4Q7NUG4_9FLAO|nr:tyrosinase family protein [Aquimarina brevivitae]RZS90704.1 tyrosinase [Aquimarina brevivitae]
MSTLKTETTISKPIVSHSEVKTRYSVRELQDMHESGNKKPLENLVQAWIGITSLPADDLNSFFVIGGYHGEPFEGQGAKNPDYWGGYCNHGNVLFPTWHRVYVLRIEQALQSIVPDVTMPYWDETTKETIEKGIPWVLTDEQFVFSDGTVVTNPLKSYVLQKQVNDDVTGDNQRYTKPAGYATVRYPLSGLVGTEEARKATEAHNAKFPDPVKNTVLLNDNVKAWLKGDGVSPTDPNPQKDGVYWEYKSCLEAPNYTAFSNTTSAAAWNEKNSGIVTPLESPHNHIHLAVGGFDIPNQGSSGQIKGANGDMGENNTAGLDPIFFFHHCNVDRMFWLWQIQNNQTDSIEIIPNYAGTDPNTLPNGQGPAAGQDPNQPLTLETPLKPFVKQNGGQTVYYTSKDCINSETQLGITYSNGSFSEEQKWAPMALKSEAKSAKKLMVSGIDRSLFSGSFVVVGYIIIDGKKISLGKQSILSRWNVASCANCQNHLEVKAFFDLSHFSEDEINNAEFDVDIIGRSDKMPKALDYQFDVLE